MDSQDNIREILVRKEADILYIIEQQQQESWCRKCWESEVEPWCKF